MKTSKLKHRNVKETHYVQTKQFMKNHMQGIMSLEIQMLSNQQQKHSL